MSGCSHVVGKHDICACAMKAAVPRIGVVYIGNPSILSPSPSEWAKNHCKTRSLILSAPTSANMTTIECDLTLVKTLRELHVTHPVYLDLSLAPNPSRHWLFDMVKRNQSLEKLTLYGPGNTGCAHAPILPFKMLNYFSLGRGSRAVLGLSIQSLTLRHFIVSDTELNNLLTLCPKLTRLELERVDLVTESHILLSHNGLQEIVLAQTTPTPWLIQVLAGVHTLVLKGDVDPPIGDETRGTRWRISRNGFERLVLGMPLLLTVKTDRVNFREEDLRTARSATHPRVLQVFKTADINLIGYFPKAVIEPYKY
ncbi:hypothetical protein BGZ93_003638 [Podila epicladia]|nr:hypothetical protein BGZ92_003260 [Podila epicladia]KAG0100172.1 hypothetical protein BGZ93_003638 [Podila epicladia]